MSFPTRLLLALMIGFTWICGCGPSGVKEQEIQVKQQTALDRAKALLENYSKGQPLGSETMQFESLVQEVRQTDSAKADILEKGFNDLKKTKGDVSAKAKELLKKL